MEAERAMTATGKDIANAPEVQILLDRIESLQRENEELRKALVKLEREASEVSKLGAVPGRHWTILAGALINARTALGTKLYAAPPAPSVAEEIADAVLSWMVRYDLLDAGNEYRAADVVAVLDDFKPSYHAALSAQVQGVAGWQPIETAPKDGSEILALWKRSQIQSNGYGVVWFEDGSWREFDYECLVSDPTHWMPLPSPPAAPAKQEGGQ